MSKKVVAPYGKLSIKKKKKRKYLFLSKNMNN